MSTHLHLKHYNHFDPRQYHWHPPPSCALPVVDLAREQRHYDARRLPKQAGDAHQLGKSGTEQYFAVVIFPLPLSALLPDSSTQLRQPRGPNLRPHIVVSPVVQSPLAGDLAARSPSLNSVHSLAASPLDLPLTGIALRLSVPFFSCQDDSQSPRPQGEGEVVGAPLLQECQEVG